MGSTAGEPRVIIINADDWGRSESETDAAARCFERGRITSVSAMMFMRDSVRASTLARDLGLEVGLHLNLSQPFDQRTPDTILARHHERIVTFLTRSRYSMLFYDPRMRQAFRYVYEAQVDEFVRLYGTVPSHIDGHHHKHLCMNMLIDGIIPRGQKVRRNFFYWPGEKSVVNRGYRSLVDFTLRARYRVTDYLFSLSECLADARLTRVLSLAESTSVELMTHPAKSAEIGVLMGDRFLTGLGQLKRRGYRSL
jgi:predicted glycoside hydrolase/deacetylase ChbG (UPF0249 family)